MERWLRFWTVTVLYCWGSESRISVLFSFNWRKLWTNQSLIFWRQFWVTSAWFGEIREVDLGIISIAVKRDVWVWIILPKGSMYRQKRNGPKLNPRSLTLIICWCGGWATDGNSKLSVWKCNSGTNQAIPEMLTQCVKRSRRSVWSTVSKAELRSRRIKIEHLPTSTVQKSFVTLGIAVSVLWCFRNPDWNFSKILFWFTRDRILKTTFSKTLYKTESLEIGLKLFGITGSRPGFFLAGLWHA